MAFEVGMLYLRNMSETAPKVFVREKSSGKVLTEESTWVLTPAEAKLFPTMYDAFHFCRTQQLAGAEIVMRLGLPEFDVVVEV